MYKGLNKYYLKHLAIWPVNSNPDFFFFMYVFLKTSESAHLWLNLLIIHCSFYLTLIALLYAALTWKRISCNRCHAGLGRVVTMLRLRKKSLVKESICRHVTNACQSLIKIFCSRNHTFSWKGFTISNATSSVLRPSIPKVRIHQNGK